jgi:hypothetical protein
MQFIGLLIIVIAFALFYFAPSDFRYSGGFEVLLVLGVAVYALGFALLRRIKYWNF